jgi:hypothetical protein
MGMLMLPWKNACGDNGRQRFSGGGGEAAGDLEGKSALPGIGRHVLTCISLHLRTFLSPLQLRIVEYHATSALIELWFG